MFSKNKLNTIISAKMGASIKDKKVIFVTHLKLPPKTENGQIPTN